MAVALLQLAYGLWTLPNYHIHTHPHTHPHTHTHTHTWNFLFSLFFFLYSICVVLVLPLLFFYPFSLFVFVLPPSSSTSHSQRLQYTFFAFSLFLYNFAQNINQTSNYSPFHGGIGSTSTEDDSLLSSRGGFTNSPLTTLSSGTVSECPATLVLNRIDFNNCSNNLGKTSQENLPSKSTTNDSFMFP